jgi:hypothetical protein
MLRVAQCHHLHERSQVASDFTSSFRHYKNIFGYICLAQTTCGRILHCREHNAVLTREFLRGRSRTKVTLSRVVPAVPEPHPAQEVLKDRGPHPAQEVLKDRGPPTKRWSLRTLGLTHAQLELPRYVQLKTLKITLVSRYQDTYRQQAPRLHYHTDQVQCITVVNVDVDNQYIAKSAVWAFTTAVPRDATNRDVHLEISICPCHHGQQGGPALFDHHLCIMVVHRGRASWSCNGGSWRRRRRGER